MERCRRRTGRSSVESRLEAHFLARATFADPVRFDIQEELIAIQPTPI